MEEGALGARTVHLVHHDCVNILDGDAGAEGRTSSTTSPSVASGSHETSSNGACSPASAARPSRIQENVACSPRHHRRHRSHILCRNHRMSGFQAPPIYNRAHVGDVHSFLLRAAWASMNAQPDRLGTIIAQDCTTPPQCRKGPDLRLDSVAALTRHSASRGTRLPLLLAPRRDQRRPFDADISSAEGSPPPSASPAPPGPSLPAVNPAPHPTPPAGLRLLAPSSASLHSMSTASSRAWVRRRRRTAATRDWIAANSGRRMMSCGTGS
jgi:hypothetical protein